MVIISFIRAAGVKGKCHQADHDQMTFHRSLPPLKYWHSQTITIKTFFYLFVPCLHLIFAISLVPSGRFLVHFESHFDILSVPLACYFSFDVFFITTFWCLSGPVDVFFLLFSAFFIGDKQALPKVKQWVRQFHKNWRKMATRFSVKLVRNRPAMKTRTRLEFLKMPV